MKTTAVQYPQPLTAAFSELARASARHGATAYALSLVLAGVTLLGSGFYKEITRTFGQHLLGMRAVTLWEAGFALCALVWLATTALGLLCIQQKGQTRKLGLASIGINIAAALLVACTVL